MQRCGGWVDEQLPKLQTSPIAQSESRWHSGGGTVKHAPT
jgi:hypothetical protein